VLCSIGVPHLKKLATALPSRRWYAFAGSLKGAALGVQFRALTNMDAIEKLPTFRIDIAPADTGNSSSSTTSGSFFAADVHGGRQFTTGKKIAVQEQNSAEGSIVHSSVYKVLDEINNIDFVQAEPTLFEDILFTNPQTKMQNHLVNVEAAMLEFEKLEKSTTNGLDKLERECYKIHAKGVQDAQNKKHQELAQMLAAVQNERAQFLEHGLSALTDGKKQFKANISNLVDNVTQEPTGRTEKRSPRRKRNDDD